ncbi:UNVERIFIED_CONTAM: hypothetical protein FKN15_018644 [Acipenser sinensis]
MLRAVVLAILCCVHAASGGTHSLRYFYTGVSEGMDFPEFTIVGMVDDVQHDYYDSVTKKAAPKQDWMKKSVGPEYWERQTQIAVASQLVYLRLPRYLTPDTMYDYS